MTDSGPIEPVRTRIHKPVFALSLLAIGGFTLWAALDAAAAGAIIATVLGWVSATFGGFYRVVVVAYLVFVIAVAASPLGRIRLGPDDSRPEFPLLSWGAMLFAAGIGIDLLFFCVAEPVTHYLTPPAGEGGTPAAARQALALTFLHWGLSGWGVYTLVGMALAFFSYRRGLPLKIRSALFPLLGARIHGPIGHGVDVAAVLATVFGVAASLGIGILQLTYGLEQVFGVPQSALTQVGLVLAIVVFAALSASSGVARGIRRLSEFNMALALALLVFVLAAGPTANLLADLVGDVGRYVAGFVRLSLHTGGFDPSADWLNAWTVFFWAWWIAWGPFVGLFLARISRGRTVREFAAGTLLPPLAFMMGWMSIMGNSAIGMVTAGDDAFGAEAVSLSGSAIYLFLQNLPWAGLTTVAVSVLAVVFFVTSGDSASLVLANFTSTPRDADGDGPVWLRCLWAAVIGALTVVLLVAGGLAALQSTVVIMGLPFAMVLLLVMAGLYRALRVELPPRNRAG
ncbi:MAG: choline BCCT transporter BetT [Pseudomonadales bacterium]